MERNQRFDNLETIGFIQSASYNLLLSQDNETVTNSKKITNIFNDYVSTIAEETKTKIRFSNKSFDEFLQYTNKKFVLPKTN